MTERRLLLAALLLAAACNQNSPTAGSEPAPRELPSFTLRELGLLPGGTQSQAFAINTAGLAVGYATDAAGVRRAVYFDNGAAIRLPEPANTTRSDAYGINDAGVIVGSVRVNGVELPARWASITAQPTILALLPGTTSGRARSINNNGVIAGFVNGDEWAVVWEADGDIEDVNPTAREPYEPLQINDDDTMVGNAEDREAGWRWEEDDGFEFLGSLEFEDDEEFPESEALGISPTGIIVGGSETADGLARAFRWTEARGMVRLGEPPSGDTGVIAHAINRSGLIAGASYTTNPAGAVVTSRPVVTFAQEERRPFTALLTLGGTRAEPSQGQAMNSCGAIVGWSFPTGSTLRRAVAWIPTGCTVR